MNSQVSITYIETAADNKRNGMVLESRFAEGDSGPAVHTILQDGVPVGELASGEVVPWLLANGLTLSPTLVSDITPSLTRAQIQAFNDIFDMEREVDTLRRIIASGFAQSSRHGNRRQALNSLFEKKEAALAALSEEDRAWYRQYKAALLTEAKLAEKAARQ